MFVMCRLYCARCLDRKVREAGDSKARLTPWQPRSMRRSGSIAGCCRTTWRDRSRIAEMLAAQGLISAEDAAAIVGGLRSVAGRLASGELPWDAALEDVHMNVEARLIDEIGDAGRRLHTARSRNDQVATDLRLYARDAAHRLIAAVDELRRALVRQARPYRHADAGLHPPTTRAAGAPRAATCWRTTRCSSATGRIGDRAARRRQPLGSARSPGRRAADRSRPRRRALGFTP